jgi:hypothetical protein
MIIPTKHESLSENLAVVGADLIEILKRESFNIENLYRILTRTREIHIDVYFDVLTFLWLSKIIDYRENIILLRGNTNEAS